MFQRFTLPQVSQRIRFSKFLLLLACAVLFVPAYATDPWENTNRKLFGFNEQLDTLVLRPVAKLYRDTLPRPVKASVRNFFSNLNDVNVLVNDLLQLKFEQALNDSGRLLINTSIGVGGLLDVARGFGLNKNEEDFGQTLTYWNVTTGPYVMLPVFGASTVRDGFGRVVDTLVNPLRFLSHEPTQLTLFSTNEIDNRAALLSLDELIVGDRYLFIREAYLQRREFLVRDGRDYDPFGSSLEVSSSQP